ncbi:IS1595 family transposase [Alicyclobacillus fodiniaquatilis]|uniref:IS1595 family transposase n=1 Tax=Alicyclobacillus fodiniaquatilis TaxID=1661150 RepID=A0ABW4JIY4_9BACL
MKQKTLNLLEIQRRFSTEEACREHLFQIRWPEGFQCPKCDHHQAYVITDRHLHQCANCHHQVSVTAGTIFHKTHTSLVKWFLAIYLVSHDKRGVSASFLARELDLGYKTAWLLLHKIRKAMRDRDAKYQLAGIVELDEAFFGAPKEGGKRGRGTEKAMVLVALTLTQAGHPEYVKFRVIPNVKSETLIAFAKEEVTSGSTIVSDDYRSYKQLASNGYAHDAKKFDPLQNPDHLKWIHTIIGNAKAYIAGTYHGLNPKYLETYLDEFGYRFNRRHFVGEWFDRLLAASTSAKTITLAELKG